MIALADIRQFETELQSALGALDTALAAQVLAENLPLIGTGLQAGHSADDAALTAISALRTALLAGLATLQDVAGHSAGEIENAINTALTNAGLGSSVSVSETADGFTFGYGLSRTSATQLALASDFGLPGLALSVAGSADVALDLSATLDFGFDADGFFLDTTSDDLILDVAISNAALDANTTTPFGALNFSATDAGSGLTGDINVDLIDADGKLRAGEAVSLVAEISAVADLDIDLAADLGTQALPSVSAVLNVDWEFISATIDPTDTNVSFGNVPTVTLNEVTMDLGSFIDDFLQPVFTTLAQILEPIQIALSVLTTDISALKILEDWETLLDVSGDGKVNLLDLLALAAPDLDLAPIEEAIQLAQDIVAWAGFFNDNEFESALLEFGDFAFDTGTDIRDALFDLAQTPTQFGGLVDSVDTAIAGLQGLGWDAGAPGETGRDTFQEIVDGTAITLPILTDPDQVISLLLGGAADLIEVDFPEFGFSVDDPSIVSIPVFPGISAIIGGSLGVAFDLAFGYDTSGLAEGNAIDGLYIIDGAGPEVEFSAGIALGVALDALIASVYGSGDIEGTILLDLADALQTTPGRLYADEFAAALAQNPFSLFDVSGAITAALSLGVEIAGAELFRLASPRLTLASFSFDGAALPDAGTQTSAIADQSSGVLTIKTGPLAGDRLIPDTTDGDEYAFVSGISGGVLVEVLGNTETFSGTTAISAAGGAGADQLALDASLNVSATLTGDAGFDLLQGGAAADSLDGGTEDDIIIGLGGNDTIEGGAGGDIIEGGAGADIIYGGADTDLASYISSTAGVSVNFALGTATGGDAQGDVFAGIEILQGSNHDDTLTGDDTGVNLIGLSGNDSLTGGALGELLAGNSGNDTLDGRGGADTLVGAEGDDIYAVDNIGDIVDENRFGEVRTDGGTDLIIASLDWSLEPTGDIEQLWIERAAQQGTGNALDNVLASFVDESTLDGRGGADIIYGGDGIRAVLIGGTGIDQMFGGTGLTEFHVDDLGDIISTNGIGEVVAMSDYVLPTGENIRKISVDPAQSSGLNLQGNEISQTLIGGIGDDLLEGRDGADLIYGGLGTDTATYENAASAVEIDLATMVIEGVHVGTGGEEAGDAFDGIEVVEGSAFNDTLTGDDTGNTLRGGGLDDSLFGLAGNDLLVGGDGADLIDGGTGADTLVGGNGSDTYIVDDVADIVTEIGTGIDLVRSSVDFSFATNANLNDLILTGTAVNGTGNSLANTITGNAVGNTLDGLGGADLLTGNGGDDVYRVETTGDRVVEAIGEGDDLIELAANGFASWDMRLDGGGVEDLTIIDSGSATIDGNTLDNVITGGAGSQTLFGHEGSDVLYGGVSGTDIIYGGDGDDAGYLTFSGSTFTRFDGGAGLDTIVLDWSGTTENVFRTDDTAIGYSYRTSTNPNRTALLENVEIFDITSADGDDQLYGGDHSDRFEAGLGQDRIYGGLGGGVFIGGVAGGGSDGASDFVQADILMPDGSDLGLDFTLKILDTHSGAVTVNAGTPIETIWEGVDLLDLQTGSGNDTLDQTDVYFGLLNTGVFPRWDAGAGDDHFIGDSLIFGDSSRPIVIAFGEGTDKLTLDWGGITNAVTYNPATGELRGGFFSGGSQLNSVMNVTSVEQWDIVSGTRDDILYGGDLEDRFVTGDGRDRVWGGLSGGTYHLGSDGGDFVQADIFTSDGTDLGLDFNLTLLDTQSGPVITNAGTAVESSWEGIELIDLETGAGNDTLDTTGVFFGATNQGMVGRWDANGGDDHFIGDTGVYGVSSLPVIINLADGFDRLTLDWALATNNVTMNEVSGLITGGTSTVAHVIVTGAEVWDITSGSNDDILYGGDEADRFVSGDGRDRIWAGLGGGTVHAGSDGGDFVQADIFTTDGTDLGLDFNLTLFDTQSGPVVTNAGTAVEMSWEGIELLDLETGSGNDTLDATGVYFGATNQGMVGRWDANGGDDHFIGDTGVYGSSSLPVRINLGEGFDKLTLDWSLATNVVNMDPVSGLITGGTGSIANVIVTGAEVWDVTSGTQSDVLYGGDFEDRFVSGEGRDRIFMGLGGGYVDAGAGGDDFVQADIFASDGTDLGLDFNLKLLDTQGSAVVTNAGTAVETTWVNVELLDLETGSGNDTLDTTDVYFGITNQGSRPRWDAGAGDDHFIGDSLLFGSTSLPVLIALGEGTDTFSWDVSNVTGNILMTSGSGTISGRYRSGTFETSTTVATSGVERWDIATGAGNDVLYGGDDHDVFDTGDGRDRIFMGLGGFSIDAGGGGDDFVVADILASDGSDLALDFELSLLDSQSGPITINAGTSVETTWENVEMVDLLTGSGNDMLDQRGVFFGLTNLGSIPRWDGGDGDDHFMGDALIFGDSSRPITINLAGGTDTVSFDWSNITANLNVTAGDGSFAARYRSGTFETNTRLATFGVEHWNIIGGSGADQFTGGAFADRFDGEDGADTLRGLGGDDGLYGGEGGDRLEGGEGNDTVEGGVGADFMYGGEGIDTLSYESSSAGVIIDLALASADGGDAVGDRITSFENILGSAHDDLLTGNDEANTIKGNDGIDIIIAGIGDDDVYGGLGTDAISGGEGNDTLTGGEGNDVLSGGADADLIYGGEDDDFIVGGAGDDTLFGDAGNDTLLGEAGSDTMDGGAGDDRFFVESATDVVIEAAGGGYDRVFTEASIVLGDHIEAANLTGTADLAVTASTTGTWIDGNGGDNTLTGQQGNDRLDGNAGNDTLDGAGGNDILEGGSGADVFALSAGVDLILDFEDGSDLIDLTGLGLGVSDLLLNQAGSHVQVQHGLGMLTVLNTSLGDVTSADFIAPLDPAPPVVTGTAGNDILSQSTGPLEVRGLEGNDLLRVFLGSATLVGGPGDDRYYVYDEDTTIVEQADEGNDSVYTRTDLTLGDNVETGAITGTGDLDLTGNAVANLLSGNADANVLQGLAGTDRLVGKAGDDTLDGGADNDILEGGAGADTFLYRLGDGIDLIQDFETGTDVINLDTTGLAFADLTILDSGSDAVVRSGSEVLVVVAGVSAVDLDEDQFSFGP
ncbi:MAG: hypothetical protein AAGD13_09460 [Pseudomonadota bacterium]